MVWDSPCSPPREIRIILIHVDCLKAGPSVDWKTLVREAGKYQIIKAEKERVQVVPKPTEGVQLLLFSYLSNPTSLIQI